MSTFLGLKFLNIYAHIKYLYVYGTHIHLHIYAYTYTYLRVLCAKLLQSCLTLCNPADCSPPGFSVRGILQARILEWIAIPFSRDHQSTYFIALLYSSPKYQDTTNFGEFSFSQLINFCCNCKI